MKEFFYKNWEHIAAIEFSNPSNFVELHENLKKCIIDWIKNKKHFKCDISSCERWLAQDDWQEIADASGKSIYVIDGILTGENQLQETREYLYTKRINEAFYEAVSNPLEGLTK